MPDEDPPDQINGEGTVKVIGGAVGLRMPNNTMWYPNMDLEDFEGDKVRVTIERLSSGIKKTVGFKKGT